MAQFEAGTILANRYRLESLLGQGGMGSVWRARHLTLNSPLAIKFINAELAKGADMMARFTREAQAAAALHGCPNVVQTIDHGVHEGIAFIAMELMQGEDLAARLQKVGQLSPAATARILSQAGRAMSRAHAAGIVHRDLKPDNIFLALDDDDEIAKVLDFGIAKILDGSLATGSRTNTGAVMGTPFYMSPEQAEGSGRVDHRTDIWAIGVIACECLTGRHAFDGSTLAELVLRICTRPLPVPSTLGNVPAGFDTWFARSCARDPDARFPSVRAQLQALREACGLPIESERLSDTPEPSAHAESPFADRHRHATTAPVVSTGYDAAEALPPARRRWPLVAAAVGVAVIGGGGWLLISGSPSLSGGLTDASPESSLQIPEAASPGPSERVPFRPPSDRERESSATGDLPGAERSTLHSSPNAPSATSPAPPPVRVVTDTTTAGSDSTRPPASPTSSHVGGSSPDGDVQPPATNGRKPTTPKRPKQTPSPDSPKDTVAAETDYGF